MTRENYDAKKFGERIKKIRRKNEMTQEQLAEIMYLSVDSISRIENRKVNCMPEHVVKLCNVFDVSADYFYFGETRDMQVDDEMGKIFELLENKTAGDKRKVYEILKLMFEIR